ncbi:MAG: GtrA family protein [Oscillospiraceae bacterium]|nr:GtrA family protein [Oscillospiraceae bacterium]
MKDKYKAFYGRFREYIVYMLVGGLTTIVNLGVYQGLELLLQPRLGDHSYLISTALGFVTALVVAFLGNKVWVFQQHSWEKRTVLREASAFTAARVLSFAMDFSFTYLFFDWLWKSVEHWFAPWWQVWSARLGLYGVPVLSTLLLGKAHRAEDAFRFIAKWLCISVVVLIMNYIFSKFFIFKKAKEPAAGAEAAE